MCFDVIAVAKSMIHIGNATHFEVQSPLNRWLRLFRWNILILSVGGYSLDEYIYIQWVLSVHALSVIFYFCTSYVIYITLCKVQCSHITLHNTLCIWNYLSFWKRKLNIKMFTIVVNIEYFKWWFCTVWQWNTVYNHLSSTYRQTHILVPFALLSSSCRIFDSQTFLIFMCATSLVK